MNINKTVSILTIVSILSGLLIAADNRWEDEPLLKEYATQKDMKSIQADIIRMRIDSYEDKIFEIKDKEIDGTITPTDLKKLHRYKVRINDLKSDLLRLQ